LPSAAVLALVDARGRRPLRAGGGLTVMFGRAAALELLLFEATGRQRRSALFTVHSAAYSDFLGAGRRRWLNPYLGLLVGGGSLDGLGFFTAGASAGVELYRGPRLLVDVGARAQGLFHGKDDQPADLALQMGVGVGFPF
jgi:hypothetical protein